MSSSNVLFSHIVSPVPPSSDQANEDSMTHANTTVQEFNGENEGVDS
jgi:hypothetical protein